MRSGWFVVPWALALGCGSNDLADEPAADDGGVEGNVLVRGSAVDEPKRGEPLPPASFCGDGELDEGEACDDGNDSAFDGCRPDCTAVATIDPPPLEWTYYEIAGTKCLDGQPAGFGISKSPGSTKVMIYLEGGGACFNDACDFSAFSMPFVPPPDGIFNRNNPENPVGDWTMIYVPYCSGDIHAGDGEAVLGGQKRYFHGYRNVTRFLEVWVPSLTETSTVLLTGISAGGFGAGINASQVADAFGSAVQMVVVDDSGPPLSAAVIPPCLQQIFRQTWNLDATVLASCPSCDPHDFATGLFAHLDAAYPDMRVGLFSNTADFVIRSFMGFGWGNGQHDNCEGMPVPVPASSYESGLLAVRAAYVERASSYFIGQDRWYYNFGLNHTVLRSPTFWTTTIDGTSVPEWLAAVIAGDVLHVGP